MLFAVKFPKSNYKWYMLQWTVLSLACKLSLWWWWTHRKNTVTLWFDCKHVLFSNKFCFYRYLVLSLIAPSVTYVFFSTVKKNPFTKMTFPQTAFEYIYSLNFYAFLKYLRNFWKLGILTLAFTHCLVK